MSSSDTIAELENRVAELTRKADALEHDVGVLKEVFSHIKTQFNQFKNSIRPK